ncbi:protein kinase superfamily protein [Wolffia australiana]
MCKKKSDALAADPKPRSRSSMASSGFQSSSDFTSNGGRDAAKPSSSTSSDHLSITSIREIMAESPNLYDFSEILTAASSEHAKRLSSSSSSSWRCTIRGKEAAVLRRTFHGDPSQLRRRAAAAAAARHKNVVRLLGAAAAPPDALFLVYEFIHGASLRDCLRNPRNPEFTPIASWLQRIQIASDVAQGLQYIHHFSAAAPIHDRIKSSAIMITDRDHRAKICYFAAADLAREEEKFQGARGYIAPEVREGEPASQKSDVYAFGVVLLELISGEEPIKYTYKAEIGGYEIVSLVESAKILIEEDRSFRSWVDRRLRDSFPEKVARKTIALAVDCAQPAADRRPDMVRAAANLSALLAQSKAWADLIGNRNESSQSLAPR